MYDSFELLKEKAKFQRKVSKELDTLILNVLKNNALSNKEIFDILEKQLTTTIKFNDVEIKYCPFDTYSISSRTQELEKKNILKQTKIYKSTQKTPIKKIYSII